MIRKKLVKKTILAGPVLASLIGDGVVLGCTNDTGIVDGRDSGGAVATQEISERGVGEHGPGGEGASGEGGGSPGN